MLQHGLKGQQAKNCRIRLFKVKVESWTLPATSETNVLIWESRKHLEKMEEKALSQVATDGKKA